MMARERWQVATIAVLERVFDERVRQVAQYGDNSNLEDGTGPDSMWLSPLASNHADDIQVAFRHDYEDHEEQEGLPTWMHLIREEVAEAFQEDDPERLTAELLQVAALCVSWVEIIEKRV